MDIPIKSILVVEDEPALLEAVKLKLARANVRVLTATNGAEALEILAKTVPTLMWLDILMPGKNGLEVLAQIRATDALKALPVVMVSVSGGPEKIRQAFGYNVLDYIVKSEYTIDDIVTKMLGILTQLP